MRALAPSEAAEERHGLFVELRPSLLANTHPSYSPITITVLEAAGRPLFAHLDEPWLGLECILP